MTRLAVSCRADGLLYRLVGELNRARLITGDALRARTLEIRIRRVMAWKVNFPVVARQPWKPA